jgi:hypothetical protein
VLRVARAHAVRERRNTLQLLRMTIVAAPDELRDQVRNLTRMQLIRILAAWRPDVSNAADPVTAHRVALKSMARRYLELSDEITDLDELINPLVEALAPQLLARLGIGIEVAGQMLVTAGGNPDRMGSEAAFAMLCGAAPPARLLRLDPTSPAQTAAATGKPTALSISLLSAASAWTPRPAPTSHARPPKATPNSRSSAA